MPKKYKLEFTEAELNDLDTILDVCERDGWYFGRKDYWDKHFHQLKLQTEYALRLAQIDREKKK